MIEEVNKYEVPRYQIMCGAKYWEKITPEYELVVECDSFDLLIMLDTRQPLHRKGKNFRHTFSMSEDRLRPKQFESVNDLFQAIQKENICTVDPQNGILRFAFPSGMGQTKVFIDIKLEKIDLNEYFRLELEFRRLARRQFHAEKELRQESKELRQEIKHLKQIQQQP